MTSSGSPVRIGGANPVVDGETRVRTGGAATLPSSELDPWLGRLGPGGQLRGADLRQRQLAAANLEAAMLGGAQLDESVLEAARLERADLSAASLRRVDANGADLREALLEDADLTEASLRFAVLDGAVLEAATLVSADLWGARLRGADLRHANLEHAQLEEADLTDADLTGANLRGAVLRRAVFTGAQLNGADLRGAVVDGTDFANADLGGARLEGLVLLSSRIEGIGLANALLDRTVFDPAGLDVIREERAHEWAAAARAYFSLERNYISLGESEEASRAYRRKRRMQKLAAGREARQAFARGETQQAVGATSRAVADQFAEWVCDYGESIPRVLGSIVALFLMFAGLYAVTGAVVHVDASGLAEPATPFDLLAWSFAAMVNGAGPTRESLRGNELAETLATIEAFVAFGLTGLLGFVLGNRIRR